MAIPPPPNHLGNGLYDNIFDVPDLRDQRNPSLRHDDLDDLEDLSADAQLGKGKKKSKKNVPCSDDDPKDKKSAKPVEIKYEGFILTKVIPENGDKPVWSRVVKLQLPFADEKLAEMARRNSEKTGVGVGAFFTKALSSEQQGIVDRIVAEKNMHEKNSQAEWVLFDVVKVEKDVRVSLVRMNRIVQSLRVIIRRQAIKSGIAKKPNTSAVYEYGEIIDLSVPLQMKDGNKTGRKDKKPMQPDLDDDTFADIVQEVPRAKPRKKKRQDQYAIDPFADHAQQNAGQHNNGRQQDNFVPQGDQGIDPFAPQNYQNDPFAGGPIPGAIPIDQFPPQHHVPLPPAPMPPHQNPFYPEVGPREQYELPPFDTTPYEPPASPRIHTRPRSHSRLRREELEQEDRLQREARDREDRLRHEEDERRRSLSRQKREGERERRRSKEMRNLKRELADVKDKVQGWNNGSASSATSDMRDDLWSEPPSARYSTPNTSPDRDRVWRPSGSLHRRASDAKVYRHEPRYYKDRRGQADFMPTYTVRDEYRGRRPPSDFSSPPPQRRPQMVHQDRHDDYPEAQRPRYVRRVTDYPEAYPEADYGRQGRDGIDYTRPEPSRQRRQYDFVERPRRNGGGPFYYD